MVMDKDMMISLDFYKVSLIQWVSAQVKIWQTFPDYGRRDWGKFIGSCCFHRLRVVFLPITQCTDGWDFSQIPWHMVLNPISSTEALLFRNECQTLTVKRGGQKAGHLMPSWCWHPFWIRALVPQTSPTFLI